MYLNLAIFSMVNLCKSPEIGQNYILAKKATIRYSQTSICLVQGPTRSLKLNVKCAEEITLIHRKSAKIGTWMFVQSS